MEQPLDRPIWHALSSRQAAFATGRPRALRYLDDVAPFGAALDESGEALGDLAGIIPPEGLVYLLQAADTPVPPGAAIGMRAEGVQMVADRLSAPGVSYAVSELGDADAAAMQALATVAQPGPFFPRTHKLGRFIGIREQGRLVAMAGERMKLDGFTEVSGVCTHPEARGRGYAGLLSSLVANRIAERGETPFLHAYARNETAIRLYERLGFRYRCTVQAIVLRRA